MRLSMDVVFLTEDNEGNVVRVHSTSFVRVVVEDKAEVHLHMGVETGDFAPPGPSARSKSAGGLSALVLHVEADRSQ